MKYHVHARIFFDTEAEADAVYKAIHDLNLTFISLSGLKGIEESFIKKIKTYHDETTGQGSEVVQKYSSES